MENIIYKELLNIADDKGIIVLEDMLKTKDIEGFYMNNGHIEFISLNVSLKDNLNRKNFILAHELGHLELHKGQINQDLYINDSDYKNTIENEANNYAINLLDEIAQGVQKQAIV